METIYKSIPAIHADEHWVCKRKEKKRRRERKRGENDGVKDWRSGAGESEERKQGDRSLEATERQDRDKRGWFRKKKRKKIMDKEGMRPQLQETGI